MARAAVPGTALAAAVRASGRFGGFVGKPFLVDAVDGPAAATLLAGERPWSGPLTVRRWTLLLIVR
jgi:hypothetical protein